MTLKLKSKLPNDRVALITGASSGFGNLTALTLSKNGFRVFGTSRRPTTENENGVEMLQLDVSSDESARRCVSNALQKAGRIDILVNNAGQVLTGALEETSLDEARTHFETNFFGTVRMVNAILPGMRKRRSGQIINVASMAATFPMPFEGYYAAAKAALMKYTEALRLEVKNFGIRVSVIEPGFFKTNITQNKTRAVSTIDDYEQVRKRVLGVLEESVDGGDDPQKVADTIVRIIESPSPGLHYAVGKEKRYLLLKRILPASTLEAQIRKHWRLDG